MGLHYARVDPDRWDVDLDTPGCARPKAGGGDAFVLVVAGCFLHVFAVRVTVDGKGDQVPVDPQYARELQYVQDQAQEPVDTVRLPGLEGDWVVLTEPFA